MNKGFTLMEIVVVIGIIVILSAIILFSISFYINKGKDANIKGNLAVLVPAGEVWYNMGNTYNDFCESDVVDNAKAQMSSDVNVYCDDDSDEWAACAQLFFNSDYAYCVDSRGVKKEINYSCTSAITQCP